MAVIDIPYETSKVKIHVTPLIIQFLAPFSYEDEKVVPWIYGPKAFKQGHEDQPLIIMN